MKPIEIYLKRLSSWLPKSRRDIVLREVEAALLDRIDAAVDTAGRPLTADEIATELKAFGPPALVAARYMHRRPVISAMFAFIYWRVLIIAFAAVLIVQTIVVLVHAPTAPALDSAFVGGAIHRGVWGLLIAFASVTLTFTALSRYAGERD